MLNIENDIEGRSRDAEPPACFKLHGVRVDAIDVRVVEPATIEYVRRRESVQGEQDARPTDKDLRSSSLAIMASQTTWSALIRRTRLPSVLESEPVLFGADSDDRHARARADPGARRRRAMLEGGSSRQFRPFVGYRLAAVVTSRDEEGTRRSRRKTSMCDAEDRIHPSP